MTYSQNLHDNGHKAPRAAFWLGVAGVAPFAIAALGIFFIPRNTFINGLLITSILAYGAVILSFLGGVRWGVALFFSSQKEKAFEFALSIIPVMIAWPSILLPNPAVALVCLTFGFIWQVGIDIRAVKRGALPIWYGHLRIQLTIAVVSALMFAAISLL